jgi:hypothetical protein
MTRPVRRLASVGLGLHGLVHLLGFVVAWKLATVGAMPYSTAMLGGQVDVGTAGVRVLGVVWLLLAGTFVGIAVGLWRRSGWAMGVLATAASLSAFACALEIKTAYAGFAVDLVILLVLWSSRERVGKAHPAR